MKVYFYLNNETYRNIDFSNPENGNPGIGGTQFMIWSLSYYLRKMYHLNVTVLAHYVNSLPKNINAIKVNNICEAINKAHEEKVDIFVFRAVNDKEVYELINQLKLKSIAWGHNFGDAKQLKYISGCDYIKRYVCVSKEQYDILRDHKVFSKSTYIYNGLDFSIYNNINIKEKDNIVCYIGSLIPAKGFHELAKIWPKIEKKVPNAKLYVIGDGKLYNRDTKLGVYGVAEEKYEKKFMRYLVDKNGEIKSNVKLFGSIGGKEKINIMSLAKVGVVNPTGKTETFGIGAVEFQALGIPVVTKAINGFFDTVINNKTGKLVKNRKEMLRSIINLLQDNVKNNEMGNQGRVFVNETFNIKDICLQWIYLFKDIIENNNVVIDLEAKNKRNNLKWLRELNRRVKKVPILKNLPAIIDYIDIVKKLVYITFKK